MCSIEADKARSKAYEALRQQFEVSESCTEADNSSTQKQRCICIPNSTQHEPKLLRCVQSLIQN
jgi:hypothetical protein